MFLNCSDEPDKAAVFQPVAVTGTIVASAPVGTVPGGSLTVRDDGSAATSIAIEVPPGRAGLAPSLGLSYSSRAGNGLVGVGWSLTGFSQIARCGGTYAYDGVVRPVKGDAQDHFCLGGSRLTNTGGSEYRTDPDLFARVVLDGIDTRGPTSWTVYARDGSIQHFGSTADSVVQAAPVRLAWSLAKTEDRDGNYMTYTYTNKNIADQAPYSIEYTAGPGLAAKRRIEFCYGITRSDNIATMIAGVEVTTTRLLTKILERAPSDAGGTLNADSPGAHCSTLPQNGAPPQIVRTYNLAYTASTGSQRNLLTSAQQCDGAGKCLPVTTFTYTTNTPSFVTYGGAVDGGDTAHPFSGGDSNLFFADLNGDGADDMIYYSSHAALPVYVARISNKAGGFGATIPLTNIVSSNPLRAYDVNRDGAADLFDGNTRRIYYAQTTNGQFTGMSSAVDLPALPGNGTSAATGRLVDMDGDGTPDWVVIIAPNPQPGYLILPYNHTTNQWSSTWVFPEQTPAYAALSRTSPSYTIDFLRDVDGDGAPDLFASYLNGGIYNYDIVRTHAVGGEANPSLAVEVDANPVPLMTNTAANALDFGCDVWADINGDGLVDLLRMKSNLIELNTGVGFVPRPGLLPALPPDLKCDTANFDAGFRVADYNGDGAQDVLVLGNGHMEVIEGSIDGTGTLTVHSIPANNALATANTVTSLTSTPDLDGDGLYDVFTISTVQNPRTNYQLAMQRSGPPDLLTQVVNGIGTQSKVDYANIQSPGVYVRGAPSYPQQPLSGALYVVQTEYVDTGTSLQPVIAHTYTDGRSDGQGAGFLGFAKHTTYDSRTSRFVVTTYDQSRVGSTFPYRYPYLHMPSSVIDYTFVLDDHSTLSSGSYHISYSTYEHRTVYDGPSAAAFTRTAQTFNWVSASSGFDPNNMNTWFVAATALGSTYTLTEIDPTCSSTSSACGDVTLTYSVVGPSLGFNLGSVTICNVAETNVPIASSTVQVTKTCPTYTSNPGAWLQGLRTASTVTDTTPTNGGSQRTMTASYDTLGHLAEVTREPSGGRGLYQRTIFRRTNGVITSILEVPDVTDTTATGPDVRTTVLTYDPDLMFPIGTTDPMGETTTTTWRTDLAVPTAIVDIATHQTGIDHDGFGRTTTVYRPDGATIGITLFAGGTNQGPLVTTQRSDVTVGDATATYHDRVGRVTQLRAVNAGGAVTAIDNTYDSLSRLVTTTRPHAIGGSPIYTTTFNYDGLGRTTYVQRGTTTIEDHAYTYPAAGGLVDVATWDADHVRTDAVFDAFGHRHQSIAYPSGATPATTTYGYGPFDTLVTVTDPKGNVVRTQYDLAGRPFIVTDPDTTTGTMVTTSYSYDSAWNPRITTVDAKSQGTTVTFDRVGRLISRISSADGSDCFVYNSAQGPTRGTLQKQFRTTATTCATDPGSASTTLTRDSLGRVTNAHWLVDSSPYDFDYSYDTKGRLATVKYPAVPGGTRFTTSTTYNGGGFASAIQDVTTSTAKPIWSVTQFDVEGHVTNETLGNALVTTNTFAPDTGWLTDIETPNIPTFPHMAKYTYSPGGDVLTRQSRSTTGSPIETFTYDSTGSTRTAPRGAHQLASAQITGAIGAQPLYAWSYDTLGNQVTASDTLPGCTLQFGEVQAGGYAAGPHALTSYTCNDTKRTITYDRNGNTTSYWDGSATATLTYTSFNKPLTLDNASGGMRDTYDANHNRIKKERYVTRVTPPPFSERSGVWDTNITIELFEKRSGTDQPHPPPGADYVFRVPANGRIVAERFWHDTGTTGSEDWHYLHVDRLGSPERVTNAAGQAIDWQSFDAWGAPRDPMWNGGAGMPAFPSIGFTGHLHDWELGLVDMGGRHYSPKLHRALQADPFVQALGYGPSWNRYSYVFNNPLKHTDPSGYFGGDDCDPLDPNCFPVPPCLGSDCWPFPPTTPTTPPVTQPTPPTGPSTICTRFHVMCEKSPIVRDHRHHDAGPSDECHGPRCAPIFPAPASQLRAANITVDDVPGPGRSASTPVTPGIAHQSFDRGALLADFASNGIMPWDVYGKVFDPQYSSEQQVIVAVAEGFEASAGDAASIAKAAAMTELAILCNAAGPACRIPMALAMGSQASGHDDMWMAIGAGALGAGVDGSGSSPSDGASERSFIVGSKGAPMANAPYQRLQNGDALIGGRTFSGHALDQMRNRGLVPSVVDNAIQIGVKSADPIIGRLRYFDPINNVTVITEGGRVVTVIPGIVGP